MGVVNNLQAFSAALASVCPIDGASGDGTFWPSVGATPAQISAAQAVAASYVDPPPAQLITIKLILSRLTDAEYQALFTLANSNVALHRAIHQVGVVDLSLPAAQALIATLSPSVLTAARSAAVFVAPAPAQPLVAPISPPPPPKPITAL